MSTLVRQRALQTWVHSLCIIAVFTNPYFFNIKTVHSLQKFDSKKIRLVLLFSSIYHSTLLFCKRLPVLSLFVVKNNAVQYRSLRWVKSLMKASRVTTYECKKFELTSLSERICVPNVVQIPSEKKMFMDYQLIVLLVDVAVRLSLKICSLYKTYTWGYTWRPLACYPCLLYTSDAADE